MSREVLPAGVRRRRGRGRVGAPRRGDAIRLRRWSRGRGRGDAIRLRRPLGCGLGRVRDAETAFGCAGRAGVRGRGNRGVGLAAATPAASAGGPLVSVKVRLTLERRCKTGWNWPGAFLLLRFRSALLRRLRLRLRLPGLRA